MEKPEIRPRHLKTSEPMATKIRRGDYVPDIYPCAKLHYEPIGGFCPHICEVAYQVFTRLVFIDFLGFSNSLPPRPLRRFWRSIRQKALFRAFLGGGTKTTFYILTPFSPKNANFRSTFDGTLENFGSKRALTRGTSSVNTVKRSATPLKVRWWIRKSTLTNQNMRSVSTPEVD